MLGSKNKSRWKAFNVCFIKSKTFYKSPQNDRGARELSGILYIIKFSLKLGARQESGPILPQLAASLQRMRTNMDCSPSNSA